MFDSLSTELHPVTNLNWSYIKIILLISHFSTEINVVNFSMCSPVYSLTKLFSFCCKSPLFQLIFEECLY